MRTLSMEHQARNIVRQVVGVSITHLWEKGKNGCSSLGLHEMCVGNAITPKYRQFMLVIGDILVNLHGRYQGIGISILLVSFLNWRKGKKSWRHQFLPTSTAFIYFFRIVIFVHRASPVSTTRKKKMSGYRRVDAHCFFFFYSILPLYEVNGTGGCPVLQMGDFKKDVWYGYWVLIIHLVTSSSPFFVPLLSKHQLHQLFHPFS